MRPSRARAEAPDALRCFTVFFAHGVPLPVLRNGLRGALAPLARVQHRLGFYGGVDLHAGSGNGHETGGMSVFCGTERRSESASGGASIEQVMRGRVGAGGSSTHLPYFNMGSYFRRNDVFRYCHSWNADGSPTEVPIDEPAELFRRLFGGRSSEESSGDESVSRRRRFRRSILDTVLEDYRHLTSDAGPLTHTSRARVREHLERLRELEQRVEGAGSVLACATPDPVGTVARLWNEEQDTPPNKPTVVPERWLDHWELMSDLYALGVHCDLFRFGHVSFQGAAERVFLRGPYRFDGRDIEFDDRTDHHEAWHAYGGGAEPEPRMAWHMHFILDQTVRFLEKLDDPSHPTATGRTMLEDALVVVATELGDGSQHSTRNVLHAVSSAGGRLRTGVVDEAPIAQVDFLNTCLAGVGLDVSMGDARHATGLVDRMLT
ncbi:MAG: DUF1552 domain-containing protein [Myxococcota bacterium]|nr:DUF1552 domain-containing protein [Myxococcota bacterium]